MNANLNSTNDSSTPNCQFHAVDAAELNEVAGGYINVPVYPMPNRTEGCGTMILLGRSWPFPK